ncbi:MAG TPA: hypothetical protein VLG66_07960 [Alphaproteobacteria bacterium]|nr:hypothetical protein [Alphaproteobacteria bacterium]
MTAERGTAGGFGAYVAARRRVLEERRQELAGLARLEQELRDHLARVDRYLDPRAEYESVLPAGAAERRRRLVASLDEVVARRRDAARQVDDLATELSLYEQRIRIERRGGKARRRRGSARKLRPGGTMQS